MLYDIKCALHCTIFLSIGVKCYQIMTLSSLWKPILLLYFDNTFENTYRNTYTLMRFLAFWWTVIAVICRFYCNICSSLIHFLKFIFNSKLINKKRMLFSLNVLSMVLINSMVLAWWWNMNIIKNNACLLVSICLKTKAWICLIFFI